MSDYLLSISMSVVYFMFAKSLGSSLFAFYGVMWVFGSSFAMVNSSSISSRLNYMALSSVDGVIFALRGTILNFKVKTCIIADTMAAAVIAQMF